MDLFRNFLNLLLYKYLFDLVKKWFMLIMNNLIGKDHL